MEICSYRTTDNTLVEFLHIICFKNSSPWELFFHPEKPHRSVPKRLYIRTRGKRPNESQKAVIIDMMKSVGEIASKIWPVVYHLTHFGEMLTLTFGQPHRHLGHKISDMACCLIFYHLGKI